MIHRRIETGLLAVCLTLYVAWVRGFNSKDGVILQADEGKLQNPFWINNIRNAFFSYTLLSLLKRFRLIKALEIK